MRYTLCSTYDNRKKTVTLALVIVKERRGQCTVKRTAKKYHAKTFKQDDTAGIEKYRRILEGVMNDTAPTHFQERKNQWLP